MIFPSFKPAILTLCLAAAAIDVGCSRAPNDPQIATGVRSQIRQNSAIHGDVQAESAHGSVTLNGHVENEAERLLAGRDAAAVAGVRQVVNNLTVVPAAPPAAAPVPAAAEPLAPAEPSAPVAERTQRRTARHRAPQAGPPVATNMAANTPPPPPLPTLPAPPPISAPVPEPAPAATVAPNPTPHPTPPPQPVKHVIPSGTTLSVRLIDALDSSRNRVGDTFRATLNTPIREDGEVVIPAGADVEGRVVDVSSAGRYAGHSELELELTKLRYRGEVYPLQTEAFDRAGSSRGKGTAGAVGGTAALGAIIGAIAGGGKGAAIGTVAGAGAGGVARGVSKPQPVSFPSETVLTFRLLQPVTVMCTKAPSRSRARLEDTENDSRERQPLQPPPPPPGLPPLPPQNWQ